MYEQYASPHQYNGTRAVQWGEGGHVGALESPASHSFSFNPLPRESTGGNFNARESMLARDIPVNYEKEDPTNFRRIRYKGRIRTWPGLVLLALVVGGTGFALVHFTSQAHAATHDRIMDVLRQKAANQSISSGLSTNTTTDRPPYVDDDLVVNNPKTYPKAGCELPNYQSKNGKLWAVAKNGTEVPFQIKGVNWFGMETGLQAPFGLWDNGTAGTTVYAIAEFLQANRFNSVRLPLCVQSILGNLPLKASIVNKATNRALDLSSYVALLQSIVKSLAYRQISVVFSMHTLTVNNDDGPLWYGKTISFDQFLDAIDMLTKSLCSDAYWNVLGIDLKNEPYLATWGSGDATDFRVAAGTIGARMLQRCPKWMAFVEGVNAQHTTTIDGKAFSYYDWYGGGLQKAGTFPVAFATPHKLVYAPHYYTPAVFPAYYFYASGTVTSSSTIANYVELDDSSLRGRVQATMREMFGYLITDTGPAVLLGEFAGLYTLDAHPKKTTKRCTDYTIETMVAEGYGGGYMWSLNPESAYEFNPADKTGFFTEGLLQDNWRDANTVFLKAMSAMDKLPELKPMPCFPMTV
ncbi:Aste57867_12833 [Aphanomyces stellatus]|uniref:Aste57867_12833 protein n=1 Tax=Aphanomyces stellatus TaxID=120398 RepID=A0A485KWY2_9STRA|nr:hypothetical protein As57867_012785 [Aphanomyces stellatus]VFT89680.1 Aste57867_12833 [Aphanomyces stellatus]